MIQSRGDSRGRGHPTGIPDPPLGCLAMIILFLFLLCMLSSTGCQKSEDISPEQWNEYCKSQGASNCDYWKSIAFPRPPYGETILLRIPINKTELRQGMGFRHTDERYYEHTPAGDIPTLPRQWDHLPRAFTGPKK